MRSFTKKLKKYSFCYIKIVQVGWLYDSTTEDAHTSIGIHSRGWTSSYVSPEPPAFLGCMPPGGPEAMLQQRRWATGLLEILFTKQNPLIGIFCKKIRFRQRLAYLYLFTWGLRSIPELFYCLLPAYCVLHNSPLFPKVNLYLYMYVLFLIKLY